MMSDYINGYIQRESGGAYVGRITVDGVDLSPIEATFFQQDGKSYLWLKRRQIMEYDPKQCAYTHRERKPHWETYLEKQINSGVVAYKGVCMFMRFKYSVTGVWDGIMGNDKKRLNLFVERLPMKEQTLLNQINERRNNNK